MTPDDFDFGFSAVSDEELQEQAAIANNQEIQLLKRNHDALVKTLRDEIANQQKKVTDLDKLIKPLLKNLAKDPDKDHIYWPNRAKKLAAFTDKIQNIIYGS